MTIRDCLRALCRGLRRRCPRCGEASIFERWYTLREHCPDCGFAIHRVDSDTWAFMYVSTAGLTGVFVLAMLLVAPTHLFTARIITVLMALPVIVGSLPIRKGLAVALEYVLDTNRDEYDEGC